MKNNFKIFYGLAGLFTLIVIIVIISSSKLSKNLTSLGSINDSQANLFLTVATSSGMIVTTSSSLVTASSTSRSYYVIVNDGSNTVYLQFNDKDATVGSGLRLNAGGGSYEINPDNLYRGAIRAIASGGSSNITVMGI